MSQLEIPEAVLRSRTCHNRGMAQNAEHTATTVHAEVKQVSHMLARETLNGEGEVYSILTGAIRPVGGATYIEVAYENESELCSCWIFHVDCKARWVSDLFRIAPEIVPPLASTAVRKCVKSLSPPVMKSISHREMLTQSTVFMKVTVFACEW